MMDKWLPETCWATIRREIKNTKSDMYCQPVLTTFLQPRHIPTQGYNITQSWAPDDGHMVARNMLSNYLKRNKDYKKWHPVGFSYPHGFREIFGIFCGNSEFLFADLFQHFTLKKLGFSSETLLANSGIYSSKITVYSACRPLVAFVCVCESQTDRDMHFKYPFRQISEDGLSYRSAAAVIYDISVSDLQRFPWAKDRSSADQKIYYCCVGTRRFISVFTKVHDGRCMIEFQSKK